MNLESQVCSLELAKRLKELGVKQESVFYWNYDEYGTIPRLTYGRMLHSKYLESHNWMEASAFTVAELGEVLKDRGYGLTTFGGTGKGRWYAWPENWMNSSGAKTEADARAKMLIYLIEQGIVKNEPF